MNQELCASARLENTVTVEPVWGYRLVMEPGVYDLYHWGPETGGNASVRLAGTRRWHQIRGSVVIPWIYLPD